MINGVKVKSNLRCFVFRSNSTYLKMPFTKNKLKNKDVLNYQKEQQERLAMSIKKVKEKRKLTQIQIAYITGTSQKTISKIERGKTDANIWTLSRIGHFLNLSFCELFNDGKR